MRRTEHFFTIASIAGGIWPARRFSIIVALKVSPENIITAKQRQSERWFSMGARPARFASFAFHVHTDAKTLIA